MRVLFSTTPAHAYLLPMLPIARAFRDRGHAVAVVTSPELAPIVEPERVRLLPAGADSPTLFDGTAMSAEPLPDAVAELFAGVRVDVTADDALAVAERWRPDLVISEVCDFVGPLVAAVLRIPFVRLACGPALPPEYVTAMNVMAHKRYIARDVPWATPVWYLDTCPPAMQSDGWQAPNGHLRLRPEPYRQPWATVPCPPKHGRHRILLVFGVHMVAPTVLLPILRQLSTMDTLADAEFVVTLGLDSEQADFPMVDDRIRFTPFTPLDTLLTDVDLVVTHGGAGTTFGALAMGIPLVVVPQQGDQIPQAIRVDATGSGVALIGPEATPKAVAAAVGAVLTDPCYRDSARAIAEQIAAMPSAAAVVAQLATR